MTLNQPAALQQHITRPKRVHVIANPAAGQDQPILGALNSAFNQAGIEWEMLLTKQSGDAQRFAQEALAAGVDVVAAYGGDGTVMEVANALHHTGVPLAILPGGTANVMSVELGISGALPDAINLICAEAPAVRTIDMARTRDMMFMLRLATGYMAETSKGAEREAKNRLGNLAYMLSAIQALPNAQMSHYRLMLDGQPVEAEGVACVIANSGNMGLPGLSLARRIDVSDGLLDVLVIPQANLGALLSVAANAVGLTETLPHWQAREVTLEADPAQSIECDGEIIDGTPISASIVPAALRVIVPAVA
jgi:diacylglycerol kinase (ATP)